MGLESTVQTEDEQLARAVVDRLPRSGETARVKVEQLSATGRAAAAIEAGQRLHTAALRASSTRQRVLWLQRFVSSAVTPVQAVSACVAGCLHCCHVAVPITDVEAALLAQASGRRAAKPAADASVRVSELLDLVQDRPEAIKQRIAEHDARSRAVAGQPCPFLDRSSGMCTVYAARPTACRTHLNLDVDALLCRLDIGSDIPVPLYDSRRLTAPVLSAQPTATLADIRDFFPAPA